MSWISIDPAGTAAVARVMISAGHATLALLARVRGLGEQAGLGELRGTVAVEADSAATAIERYTEAWLTQGNEAMQRAIRLVEDQRASAVVATVPSAYGAIVAGSMIIGGGTTGWSSGGPGALGPSALVGGGGNGWSVSGPNPLSSSVVLGGMTGGGASSNPLLRMSSIIQDRQDSMRAKLAAASGARVVGSADPVGAAMATRLWNQINDKMAATGALVVAPTGARIGSGGTASAGYHKAGTYGDEFIEVPD